MSFDEITLYGRDDEMDEFGDSNAFDESVDEDFEDEEEEDEEVSASEPKKTKTWTTRTRPR